MSRYYLRALILGLLLSVVAPAYADQSPMDLIRDTSDQVLTQVAANRDEFNADPRKIYAMVDELVLPAFDFEAMSRLVLGKHWRKANDDQRGRFIVAFRELLVRTYATALVNYSGQEVLYLPYRSKEGATKATVNTLLNEVGGPSVPIDYKLYTKDDGWLVYDVVIDKVSLISNYRSSFSSQVRRHKIDGLIKKIEALNKKGAS